MYHKLIGSILVIYNEEKRPLLSVELPEINLMWYTDSLVERIQVKSYLEEYELKERSMSYV